MFSGSGSLTTILNKMEEKGLIERRILNGNRRSFHIFLTAVGKEKQQLVDTAFSEIEKKALADISEKEFEQLCRCIIEFILIYPVFPKNRPKMIRI